MRRGGRSQAAGSAWRKIAAASWGRPADPQIYGDLEVDAEPLLGFLADVRAETGVHVTVTHLVGKAIAHALAEHPDLNVRLSRGTFVRRDSVDVFFAVTTAGGRELSGVKIVAADRKSIAEIADEVARRVDAIRTGRDVELGGAKNVLRRTPTWLLRFGLRFATWLVADVGVDLERAGLPRDAFGSAIVSSVAAFGVQRAYGPLSPWYRVPVLALVSEVAEKPVVIDGEIVARRMLTITATLDHRYLDGAHAGRLMHAATAYLADPWAHENVSRTAPTKQA